MDQTADQIEAHIDRTRDRLGSNLEELEARGESAIDWRQHLRAHPRVLLGAGFAGGILLAVAMREPRRGGAAEPLVTPALGPAVAQVRELWDDIQTALISVAGTRLTAMLGELVPDFAEHYRPARPRPERRVDTDYEKRLG